MASSVFAGGTCLPEFEAITGLNCTYLQSYGYPYVQYITNETPSIVSTYRDNGYQTVAFHPYHKNFYSRNRAYPLLGFEAYYGMKDMENPEKSGWYISDMESTDFIIDTYEKKTADRLFMFTVTMQNHGGYTQIYENFIADVHAPDLNSAQLDQYLSLMKVSDQEFENLVAYFENKEEKTIIVFFGDHQPSDAVVRPILRWNQNMGTREEDAWLRYQVPYVIWANYDIEDGTDVDTDISFLAAQVLSRADMPTTAYQNFLLELAEHPDSDTLKNQYEILQYYFMFDYQETL
jgi:phosphoglycerol transferase MdoB-like AlkP superfamily enzyme